MASSSSSLFLFLLIVSLSSSIAFNLDSIRLIRDKTETSVGTISPGRKVGGRSQVQNVESDKKVQELGRFCVEEHNHHNRNNGELLSFSKVVEAQRQVVSGLKYYLRIATTVARESSNGVERAERVFDAEVVEKPWLGSRTLVSFVPTK
ncbi:hypothetical protein LUZ60_002114 [Juncus effusus]|nr:hypothetical protein LUZ60_002114 [Juncus effusus]